MRGLFWGVLMVLGIGLAWAPFAIADCHLPTPPDCGFLEDDATNKLYAQAEETLGTGTLHIFIGVHEGQQGTMDTQVPTFTEGDSGIIQYSIDFHVNDTTNGTDHPVEFEIMPGAALASVTPEPLVFTFSGANGTPQQWYQEFTTEEVQVNATYPFFYRLTAFKGTADEHVVAGRLEVEILDDDVGPTTRPVPASCPVVSPGATPSSGTAGLRASLQPVLLQSATRDCGEDTPLPVWAPLVALGAVAAWRRRSRDDEALTHAPQHGGRGP